MRRYRLERPVTWVALAGFMGTGKSRIGWELSRRLGLNFIDTDRVIERGQALWLGPSDVGVSVAPQEPGTQLFLACDGLDG